MKTVYYILTMIISLLLGLLFIIPVLSGGREGIISLIIVIMFFCLFGASLFGMIKKCRIPVIILLKAGIICGGIALFIFGVGSFEEHLNLGYFALIAVFSLAAYFCISKAVNSISSQLETDKAEKLRKTQITEEPVNTVHISEGVSGIQKIWQYKFHAKPQLSETDKAQKTTFIILSIIGIVVGFHAPFFMLSRYDMEDIFYSIPGSLCYIIALGSIFFLAVTLGRFKAHNSQNIAFVLNNDGSVFLIDYFDISLARQFGYYKMLPRIVRTGGIGGNAFTVAKLGYDSDRCLSFIRNNGIDKRIAEEAKLYGHQIIAVPEIVKCSYYTDMKFTIWKDGKETDFKRTFNLYDNCYEDYEMMVSYFEKEFPHRFDEKYVKKTSVYRGMFYTGIVSVSLSVILWLSGANFENDFCLCIGLLIMIIGSSILMTGYDNLNRRKK